MVTAVAVVEEAIRKPSQVWEKVPHAALAKMKVLFGRYRGRTFDETPLTFLDWLAGQDWFTGKAMVYVQTYLSHPAIQRQLEEELAAAEPKDSFIPTLDAVPQKDVINPNPDPNGSGSVTSRPTRSAGPMICTV